MSRHRDDELPFGERLVALQAVRTLLVVVVLVAALVERRELGRSGLLLALCAGFALASVGLEAARKVAARRTLPLLGSMLFLDVVFLGGVLMATGGPQSRLVFLISLHLVAVTLLLSFRTGLKLALWHSLLLFVGHYTRAAGLISPPEYLERLAVSDADLTRSAVVASVGFWLVAGVTAALSALTERELRRGKVQLRVLAGMGARMEASATTGEVLDALVVGVQDGFGFDRAAAVVTAPDGPHVAVRVGGTTTFARAEAAAAMASGVLARVARDRRPVLVRSLDGDADGGGDELLDRLLPFACNVVVLPLVIDGEAVGAVAVEHGGSSRTRVRARLVAMLDQYAVHAALELRNLWLLAEVRRLATTDGLTGLVNRRVLDESLEREVSRSARNGAPVSVVLLDIDHFKAVNDTHGHQVGDAVLRAAGRAIGAGVRAGDLAARYGGEEFCVVLPDCDGDEAVAIADRIRAEIASAPSPVAVTVSAGVATVPANGASAAEVLAAADEALYASKGNGRDRTTRAPRGKRRRRRSGAATLVA